MAIISLRVDAPPVRENVDSHSPGATGLIERLDREFWLGDAQTDCNRADGFDCRATAARGRIFFDQVVNLIRGPAPSSGFASAYEQSSGEHHQDPRPASDPHTHRMHQPSKTVAKRQSPSFAAHIPRARNRGVPAKYGKDIDERTDSALGRILWNGERQAGTSWIFSVPHVPDRAGRRNANPFASD